MGDLYLIGPLVISLTLLPSENSISLKERLKVKIKGAIDKADHRSVLKVVDEVHRGEILLQAKKILQRKPQGMGHYRFDEPSMRENHHQLSVIVLSNFLYYLKGTLL